MDVAIFHERTYSRNVEALLAPLVVWHRDLARDYGITLRWITDPAALPQCDVLLVHSKVFRGLWGDGGERVIAWLRSARSRAGRICWVDTSDGTGTTHFRVLPFVDRYLKNQICRDRRAYQRQLYGGRLYTDFLHRAFAITDTDPGQPHLNHPPSDADLKKVTVGWHYGFAHYGRFGELLGRVWFAARGCSRWFPSARASPFADRPVAVSCRVGVRYSRATIAFGRRMLVERLAARGIATSRVPPAEYFRELRRSLVAVSPFGYGEICYRDFEAILAGAALCKQDMGHLETWPDLWVAGATYVPFAWDGSDFDARLDAMLRDRRGTAAIAAEAQRRYRDTFSPRGRAAFGERFATLIAPVREVPMPNSVRPSIPERVLASIGRCE